MLWIIAGACAACFVAGCIVGFLAFVMWITSPDATVWLDGEEMSPEWQRENEVGWKR